MIHNDHLATPQKMTDSSGTVVWAADYKPFGEATITVSTITNNLRFPGQHFDAETGLHYNYTRDYNSPLGRYIEADRIGLKGGINRYVYVGNMPINHKDPKGRYGTNDCSYYEQRCQESGGKYYCETVKYWCNKFPKYPDPDPDDNSDFEGWSRCTRQCLQDCDKEQYQCSDKKPKPDPSTDSFWDLKPTGCHFQCYVGCGIDKALHPLTP